MSQETYITVESGKIKEKTKFQKFLFELKDGRWLVKFENKNKRSNQVNRYLHGVLFPEFLNGLRKVGYNEVKTVEQAKQIAKRMFLTVQIHNENTAEVLEFVKNTRDLTKDEATQFIDDVIQFSAENLDHQIMYPNEQATIDYE